MSALALASNRFDALFAPKPQRGAPVQIRGLSKSFGATPVLRDLNLAVPAGQFLVIVGRSGCGKSTLLRLIAGLDRADNGVIAFGPRAGTAREHARVMFQEPRLLPWASVLQNVAIGLGAEADVILRHSRAQDALEAVGLGARAAEWPAVLSGGQKQRVALARALVSAPRLLAFDEPLGALDALTRIEMQQVLSEVWERERFTAILVTHDVAEAVTLADRIVIVEDGAVALDIPVDLPRPRRRGSVDIARLEERILRHLLHSDAHAPEYVI